MTMILIIIGAVIAALAVINGYLRLATWGWREDGRP